MGRGSGDGCDVCGECECDEDGTSTRVESDLMRGFSRPEAQTLTDELAKAAWRLALGAGVSSGSCDSHPVLSAS